MKYIEQGWQRRQSILQQGVVLVAGLLFAGAALLAIDVDDGAGVSPSTAVTYVSVPARAVATGLGTQQEVTSRLSGVRETASDHVSVPAVGYRGSEGDRRAEIADRLRRQGDVAWQAGDDRAAGVLYRQSWAVMPDVLLLTATDLKRWEIVERLLREGDMAWRAGDHSRAALLYHQRQAVMP